MNQDKKEDGDLVHSEEKDSGSVKFKDVVNLLKFSIGNKGIFLYFFICISAAVC